MVFISFDRSKVHRLLCPVHTRLNTVELYFTEYSDDIDYSNGFIKWCGSDKIDENNPTLKDFSDYKYKWNVLTPMSNGIVLSKNSDDTEKPDSNFHPLNSKEIDALNIKIAESEAVCTVEERVEKLEAELAELKSNK